jgi:glutathione S-transferase
MQGKNILIYMMMLAPVSFALTSCGGEEKNKALDNAFNVVLPKELTKVEAALGKKKFLTGESLSIADFYWGNCYVSVLANPLFYEPERRAELLR